MTYLTLEDLQSLKSLVTPKAPTRSHADYRAEIARLEAERAQLQVQAAQQQARAAEEAAYPAVPCGVRDLQRRLSYHHGGGNVPRGGEVRREGIGPDEEIDRAYFLRQILTDAPRWLVTRLNSLYDRYPRRTIGRIQALDALQQAIAVGDVPDRSEDPYRVSNSAEAFAVGCLRQAELTLLKRHNFAAQKVAAARGLSLPPDGPRVYVEAVQRIFEKG